MGLCSIAKLMPHGKNVSALQWHIGLTSRKIATKIVIFGKMFLKLYLLEERNNLDLKVLWLWEMQCNLFWWKCFVFVASRYLFWNLFLWPYKVAVIYFTFAKTPTFFLLFFLFKAAGVETGADRDKFFFKTDPSFITRTFRSM